MAVSRIGFPGDGINPFCSGGSRLYGIISIGKAGQLRCRRQFARDHGCVFESLRLQAVQYDLTLREDCAAFRSEAQVGAHGWLLKPAVGSFGRGIRYIPPLEAGAEAARQCAGGVGRGIAMANVESATLDGGRKFDLRSHLLVARTRPLLAFYGRGIVRRADEPYNASSSEPKAHITNLGHMGLGRLAHKDHFWSYGRLAKALSSERGFAPGHLQRVVEGQMKRGSLFALQTMRSRRGTPPLTRSRSHHGSPGTWQVFGLDWILDTAGRASLIECNAAPGMPHYEMPGDEALTPALWTSMLELVALAQSATPDALSALAVGYEYKGWELLYNEASPAAGLRPAYNACLVPDPV